ncbi:MAG TPA: AraC family transcriptional regulator [Terriglobales bacterium]|jgi:AraC-like DNA-binding protein|nr:AraC family transcriptional regulator [Terriglobales bacterium]
MIGKTRQVPAAEVEEIYDPEVGRARGMLRKHLPAGKMRHARRCPADDLAFWIAHYWMIRWDLRGCEPYVAESLPHPNVHVIFETAGSVVAGVQTRMFSRVLEGQSQVFGIKFKPGGFRPFLKFATSKLADRVVAAESILGKDVNALESILLSSGEENEKVEAANAFFRARMPKPDAVIEGVGRIVERILEERDIKTVDDLVDRTGIGKRSLQRMFNEYVGVSPKWVIRRYRLHELVERFNSNDEPRWADLALELGYFDQAHLINDFRSITGYSPTEYQALMGGD